MILLVVAANAREHYGAIVGRDQVTLMFKAITPVVHPQPNHSRHEWARSDAYIYTDDPDSLSTEFTSRQVPMHRELANTDDGLRAFAVSDNGRYTGSPPPEEQGFRNTRHCLTAYCGALLKGNALASAGDSTHSIPCLIGELRVLCQGPAFL